MALEREMELLSKTASMVMKLEYIVGVVEAEEGCIFTVMLLSYEP